MRNSDHKPNFCRPRLRRSNGQASLGRCILATAVMITLSWAEPTPAQTNPLPQGNVTIVVPLAAGGPLDVLARILTDKLSPPDRTDDDRRE